MDFLDYGKKVAETSLTELPLTVIDIAILTELSYMVFKDFLTASCNPKKGMTLRELVHHYNRLGVTDSQRELKLSYDKRTELFDLLAHEPRYRDIIVFAHQDIYDEDKEIQFAATSFTILNQILVIYRGTDSSIIGWKEDFNLSYMTIPSQELALDYLKQLCSYNHDNLILAGHSKGGNLALYAASHLSNADSITAIYTFDSPGLSEAQIKRSDYQKIQDKIIAFRPSASIVGVLFDQQVEVTLVKSHGIGLLQHLMFLWEVDSETNSFKIASKSTPNSRNIQKLTADFLKESREEDNRNIVNLLYQALFSRTEVTTVAHRIRLFFSILFHASKCEKDALFQVGTHLFHTIQQNRRVKETTPADELRSRRLFARFFYLFELIAFRSKWLATLVSLVLFYSIYVLNRNPDINLLVFSCLYLLMLFLSSVLSLKNWLQSDNKLSFDYIPGIYSIVTLLYALLRQSDFDQVLPRSILYFLLMWVWHFAYQSYKIKPYLPDIARPMKHLAIFGLLLAGMSFKFPSLIDFLVGKGIILLLLYKACVTALIAYRLWRDDYKSSDWFFKKLKNITS